MTWEDFKRTKAPYSIALDGYVSAGPRYEMSGPWLNFNHHEEVDRLATRATCGQVLMAIKQGLFDSLRPPGTPGVRCHCWVNDCDEDVCVSWFLLRHYSLVERPAYLKLTKLVQIADALDSTAGAFPYPKDLPILQDLAWVFEPYRVFRVGGGLDRKDAEEYRTVIESVEDRIMLHITGQGSQIPLDTRYETLHQASNWSLIREIGTQAKTGIFGDGIRAYVAVREREGTPGVWTYTVGRLSPFVTKFPVPEILQALNTAEGLTETSLDRWGGANTIGGSPRVGGSHLSPEKVVEIVEEVVSEHQSRDLDTKGSMVYPSSRKGPDTKP